MCTKNAFGSCANIRFCRDGTRLRQSLYGRLEIPIQAAFAHLVPCKGVVTIRDWTKRNLAFQWKLNSMARRPSPARGRSKSRRRKNTRAKAVKKDPIFVDGERPRPMYVDYKDVDFLKKLVNRHGRIVVRRKTGCSAVSQHAVTRAVKRARFMALLPFVGD